MPDRGGPIPSVRDHRSLGGARPPYLRRVARRRSGGAEAAMSGSALPRPRAEVVGNEGRPSGTSPSATRGRVQAPPNPAPAPATARPSSSSSVSSAHGSLLGLSRPCRLRWGGRTIPTIARAGPQGLPAGAGGMARDCEYRDLAKKRVPARADIGELPQNSRGYYAWRDIRSQRALCKRGGPDTAGGPRRFRDRRGCLVLGGLRFR
jgi:hypothetical protein